MSEPTPLTITPSFSILAVTSPSESVPSVILLTEYNCSFELLLTIFSIALNSDKSYETSSITSSYGCNCGSLILLIDIIIILSVNSMANG